MGEHSIDFFTDRTHNCDEGCNEENDIENNTLQRSPYKTTPPILDGITETFDQLGDGFEECKDEHERLFFADGF